jgi:hypothetical protein
VNRTPELGGLEGREAHALKIAIGRLPKMFFGGAAIGVGGVS